MCDQPSRTLRNEPSHVEDAKTEQRTHRKAASPSDSIRQNPRVEYHDRRGGSGRGPQPKAAIDGKVDTAAKARRDQFIDCRVNRRIFTPNSCTSDEAEDCQARSVPC